MFVVETFYKNVDISKVTQNLLFDKILLTIYTLSFYINTNV